jgi:hypothetical protein
MESNPDLQIHDRMENLVNEVTAELNDIAKIEDEQVEAEATALVVQLFLHITDNDWKQAEGMATIHQTYLENGGKPVT